MKFSKLFVGNKSTLSSLKLIAFLYSMIIFQFGTSQNSMVGDGFGGRLWYQPTNYSVGDNLAFTTCFSNECDSNSNQLIGWGSNYWDWYWTYGNPGPGLLNLPSGIQGVVNPVTIPGMTNIKYVSAASNIGVIKNDGSAWVWGTSVPSSPTLIMNDVKFLDGSVSMMCFVKNDGTVWSIGRNDVGQFGNGVPVNNSPTIPIQMSSITNAVRVSTNQMATFILKADSTVSAVGFNYNGILGLGLSMYDTVLVPQTIQGLNKVIDIKSNSYFAAALTSDGSVYTWGTGLYSGLGTPLVDDIIPRKVPGLHNIVALSCTGNSYHFLALDANKNCYAWGMNLGQLGVYDALANGSNYVLTPTVVATDVIDIMAGFNFSYIVKTDGSLWCSGKSSGGSIWMNLNNTMRSVFTKIEPDSIQGTCKLLSNNLTSTNECGQQNNGIIIINHNGTNPPFQYSLGNGYQSNNVFGGLSSGNYTVSVLNSIGCVNTYTCTIDSFAGGVVNLNVNNASICNGDSTILSVSGANNYFWSSSYGISSTTGNSISANPSLTTNYLVFGNDNNGCGDTAIVNVSVGTKPIISLISDTICPGSTILIEASGATTYTWSPTESLNSTNNPNVYASPTTSTTYTLQSIDGGCVATQTVNVNVHTPPAADFIYSGSDSILVGNSIELTSISINATGIEWTSCNNIMSSNQTIQIYGEYTGTCCIKLKAEKNNCYDSISKCFVVYEPYYITIPNVFSPNGDGKNDFYKMDASGINTFHCEIYNRWGQKLYEWDGINGYWDGKTKNGIAADGTYYYVINYTTPDLLSKTAHGFITLTR